MIDTSKITAMSGICQIDIQKVKGIKNLLCDRGKTFTTLKRDII